MVFDLGISQKISSKVIDRIALPFAMGYIIFEMLPSAALIEFLIDPIQICTNSPTPRSSFCFIIIFVILCHSM